MDIIKEDDISFPNLISYYSHKKTYLNIKSALSILYGGFFEKDFCPRY